MIIRLADIFAGEKGPQRQYYWRSLSNMLFSRTDLTLLH